MLYDSLYKVLNKKFTTATIVLSDANHPIFMAHFPSNPILPGFMHFEIVSDVFGIDIISIKKAKFNKIILPNEILKYERIENKFKVFSQDIEVASFIL